MNFNKLNRKEVGEMVIAQENMAKNAMTRGKFTFPGSAKYQTQLGESYYPNAIEQSFFTAARSKESKYALQCGLIGTAIPIIASIYLRRKPQFATTITTTHVTLNSLAGGFFGASHGMAKGRRTSTAELSQLTQSPMASEIRYQVWKSNPQHPMLSDFQSQIQNWCDYKPPSNDETQTTKSVSDITKRELFYSNRQKIDGMPW